MASSIIRPRAPSDIPTCAEVLKHVYARDGYPVQGVSNAISFLSGPSTLKAWVATASDEIIGHVALSSPDPSDLAARVWKSQDPGEEIAVLERLFVDPEARGRGTAEALIRAAVEEGRARGMRAVLFALVKDRGAMRLYERCGWEVFGRDVYEFGDGERMEAVCYVSPVAQT